MDSDTTQNANSNKIRFQVGVRKTRCCRTWFLYTAKMRVCTSWHGGLAINFCVVLSPSTVIKAGIRTGNSVFVIQKMGFGYISYRQSDILWDI